MPATTTKYLAIYLNDHLAGSTGALELVKRAASEHDGPLGTFLAGLRDEIAADRKVLEELMDQLGVSPDRPKLAAAWAAEKAGRLKLNGEVRGRSPLTPLVELEALSIGIEGKRLLWLALSEVEDLPLSRERLAELVARAEAQREGVEVHRREAARRALG
ncbi:MAG TPA: hypothetical protein VGO71_18455 [Baekduia sp.]|jgi:hypothetical protein|nr:hypothetical protein [Baekduia sp.]